MTLIVPMTMAVWHAVLHAFLANVKVRTFGAGTLRWRTFEVSGASVISGGSTVGATIVVHEEPV